MGLADELNVYHKVGIDSAVCIYLLEQHPDYEPLAQIVFQQLKAGQLSGVMSEITVLETLIMPYRQNNAQAINDYLIFFDNFPNLTVYPLDRTIAQRAAQLRAAYTWLRTPDAIQVATALLNQAQAVITNDGLLKKVTELPILVLRDYLLTPPS